jgi:outer membrane autotransporter protein
VIAGGTLDLGIDRFSANRPISLGSASRIAASTHDGMEISASAQAGYRISFQTMTITPFVSADYLHLHQQGFTETGAGALDLAVEASHFDSLQPEAGLRIARVFATFGGTIIVPEVDAGFRYELLDTAANSSALLAGATSAGAFSAQGVPLDRAMADIGAKIVVHAGRALDLYAGYNARLSGNQRFQTAGLGMRYQF